MIKRATILIAAALQAMTITMGANAASELTIGRPISTSGMDPGFLREPATIIDNIFDTLVLRDEQMNLVPGLAESWQALDDRTWEFKLRRGVAFHNGEAFDAEAVKFTIDRIIDPDAKSPTISYIRTVTSVDVIDEHTVRITTDGPDPLLPTRMSRYPTYVVPPVYVKEIGREEFSRKPVGTGPYRMVEFVQDQHVILEAVPDYWRGKPAIDRVVWRPIPDATARVTSLLTGEVQLVEGVPANLAAMVSESDEVDLVQIRNGGLTVYFGMRMTEPPLDNVKVRQALNLAIDRQTIVDNLLQGMATVKGTQVGPFDFGYLEMPAPAHDPAGAKALLAEAGYPDGFTIDMQAVRRYLNGAEIGQAVAQQLGDIGVTVNLEVPEWSVYIQKVPAGNQAPLYMLGWGSTQTLDADAAIYAIFRSGEPYSTVSIPEMDALLDQSRKIVDATAREQVLHDIQRLAAEQVPMLTLHQEDKLIGKRKNVAFDGRADARIPVFDIRMN